MWPHQHTAVLHRARADWCRWSKQCWERVSRRFMCSVSCDHLDSRCASVACLTRFAKCTGTHGLGSVRARGFPTSRNTLWNAAVRAPLPRGHAPPVPRPKDPASVALPALRDAPPFVYASGHLSFAHAPAGAPHLSSGTPPRPLPSLHVRRGRAPPRPTPTQNLFLSSLFLYTKKNKLVSHKM
jgi:hypothetical protein